MKKIILSCILLISYNVFAFSQKPSIYFDVLDCASHAIKNKNTSIKGSVEYPIGKNIDLGFMAGHTRIEDQGYYTSFGTYLDYNFFETKDIGVKKSSWFIRNYIGLTKSSEKKHEVIIKTYSTLNTNNDTKQTTPDQERSWDANNKQRSWGDANTTRRAYANPTTLSTTSGITSFGTDYHPEIGVYVGKKYVFDNNVSLQFGVGISTVLKESVGNYYKIKSSDFIIDSFLKLGYSL